MEMELQAEVDYVIPTLTNGGPRKVASGAEAATFRPGALDVQ